MNLPRHIKALTVFALVCIVLAAIYRARVSWKTYSYDRDAAAIRKELSAKGVPLTISELGALSDPVADSDNAALVYLPIFDSVLAADPDFEQLHSQWSLYISIDPPDEPNPEVQASFGDYLSAHDSELRAIMAVPAMNGSSYPIRLSEYPDTDLSHLNKVRAAGRMVAIWSVCETMAGREASLVQSQAVLSSLASTLESEPTTISQIVRSTLVVMAVKDLAFGLNQLTLDDASLQAIAQHYVADITDQSLRLATYERLCGALDMLDLFYKGELWGEELARELKYLRVYAYLPFASFQFSKMTYTSLRYLQHGHELSFAPWPDRITGFINMDKNVKSERRSWDGYKTLMWNASPIIFHLLDETIDIRVARAVIGVERFRLRHGRLPDRLDDLVPEFLDEVPMDPMSDDAIRYRTFDGGYTVYSIFLDEEDNGGTSHDSETGKGDRGITVLRAAPSP